MPAYLILCLFLCWLPLAVLAGNDIALVSRPSAPLLPDAEMLNDEQLAQYRGRYAENLGLRQLEIEMLTSWQEQEQEWLAGVKIELNVTDKPRVSVSVSHPGTASAKREFDTAVSGYNGLVQVNLLEGNNDSALNTLTITNNRRSDPELTWHTIKSAGSYAAGLGSADLLYTVEDGRVGFAVKSEHGSATQMLAEQGILQQIHATGDGQSFTNRMTLNMDWDQASANQRSNNQLMIQALKLLPH